MRLAWVCPISARTGVGTYAQSVLRALTRRKGLEVVVLHPPCPAEERLEMPCPTLPLSDALVASDLPALFDLMLYHLGNNDRHHGLILRALMAHPGPVVLHDHVYQHMLAGLHHDGRAPAPGFGALIHAVSGASGFDYLSASGVLRASRAVSYVPWESSWAAQVPLSDVLARLATGVITHSDFAAAAMGDGYPGSATTLFMPRPDVPVDPPDRSPGPGTRLRLAATGHIGPTKGLELLIDALASAPDLADRYSVTIAGHSGDAAYMQGLETRVAAQGLDKNVRLVPDPDAAGFRAVMQEADLFLNLRRPNTEGASLSLAEQLASGRPVIVQNSGCFAEMPATCGWHLPTGATAGDLAATLQEIARDPSVITKRGRAAARYMTKRSATVYADKLASFLYAGQARLARRADAIRTRTLSPDTQDGDWHSTYIQVRGLMSGILAGRGLLPPDLWAYPDGDIGQYVALNLLNTPVSDPATFARALQQGGPLPATRRLGLLRQLLARACATPGDTGHHISDLALPVTDPALWTALLCLPSDTALPMALQALGQRTNPDAQAQLTRLAARNGTGATLLTYLDGRGDPVMNHPDMAAIHRLLQDPDGPRLTLLPPLAPEADLVQIAAKPQAQALQLSGFHPPDPAGIWTADPKATLRTVIAADHPVTRLSGAASLLEAALAQAAQTVTVETTEETTGRSARWSDTRPQGGDPSFDWVLPLPRFTGPVRIDLTLPACYSPHALGVSPDPRPLGILLRSLRLESAPAQLEAAE
ncbi:glycosyltransferase family 4 protein [Marivita hallyeonensis]|uniref:Glycosyltransferase involved in cell wall bisynthesis n=1 Tax=Marivita hallyeonensis TaxID=996342 RepID=A0A1M5Y6H5_9RHOB|nr:glycosyltransferase family 4 protein [Marivita hallyeonensis]SHI07572.1 Glycosyltransferase involved in cell wall bisynthesis [Marivita hallyeonensis]